MKEAERCLGCREVRILPAAGLAGCPFLDSGVRRTSQFFNRLDWEGIEFGIGQAPILADTRDPHRFRLGIPRFPCHVREDISTRKH